MGVCGKSLDRRRGSCDCKIKSSLANKPGCLTCAVGASRAANGSGEQERECEIGWGARERFHPIGEIRGKNWGGKAISSREFATRARRACPNSHKRVAKSKSVKDRNAAWANQSSLGLSWSPFPSRALPWSLSTDSAITELFFSLVCAQRENTERLCGARHRSSVLLAKSNSKSATQKSVHAVAEAVSNNHHGLAAAAATMSITELTGDSENEGERSTKNEWRTFVWLYQAASPNVRALSFTFADSQNAVDSRSTRCVRVFSLFLCANFVVFAVPPVADSPPVVLLCGMTTNPKMSSLYYWPKVSARYWYKWLDVIQLDLYIQQPQLVTWTSCIYLSIWKTLGSHYAILASIRNYGSNLIKHGRKNRPS